MPSGMSGLHDPVGTDDTESPLDDLLYFPFSFTFDLDLPLLATGGHFVAQTV